MSGHTIVNLKQLDASERARERGIEARMGRSALDSEHLGISYFGYGPNTGGSVGHRHTVQEEAYVVLRGSGQVRLDDEVHDLSQWDVVRVSPQVIRGFRAGPDGMDVLAIGSDRPEGGDGEVISDWWTD